MLLMLACFTLLLFFTSDAQTDIYRCEDASGNINFKDQPCLMGLENKQNSRVNLKPINVLERNVQVENYQQDAQLRDEVIEEDTPHEAEEIEVNKRKTNCMAAKRNYQREAKLVKKRCAKARDIFCNLDAEDIQFKWDWNFSHSATDEQIQNIKSNGAVIYQLKEVMDNDCRS